MLRWFFFILCFSFSFFLSATHVIGGEMNYVMNADGTITVQLVVYKDCQEFINNGDTIVPIDFTPVLTNPPAPNVSYAQLNVFYNNDIDTTSYYFTTLEISDVTIDNPSPCTSIPDDYCIKKGVYTVVINPPPSTTGYTLAYQACCRNPQSDNVVVNPFLTGTVIYTTVPLLSPGALNSNPTFEGPPPMAMCKGIPIFVNSVAFDAEGDSIAYRIISPKVTAQNTQNIFVFPPFQAIDYQIPYTFSDPIDANPPLTVDESSGLFGGIPDQEGVYLIGVEVLEYRDGVLISSTIRDFRTIVFECQDILPSFEVEDHICDGQTTVFVEAEGDTSLTYVWDFGDLTTSQDTATGQQAQYTYTNNGIYEISLIATYESICRDTIEQSSEIYFEFEHSISYSDSLCASDSVFNAELFTEEDLADWQISWEILETGDRWENIPSIQYSGFAPGEYTLLFSGVRDSCQFSDEYPFTVSPNLFENIPQEIILCSGDSFLIDIPLADGDSLFWFVGDSLFAVQSPFQIHATTDTILPLFVLSQTALGCEDSLEILQWIQVYQRPTAGFELDTQFQEILEPITLINTASDYATMEYTGENMQWINDSTLFFDIPGNYTITQTVFGEDDQCPEDVSREIEIVLNYFITFPNAFTPRGYNALFTPITYNIPLYSMQIIDRWGKVVYDGAELLPSHTWDGRVDNGELAKEDLYNVVCTYTTVNDELLEYQGVVMLLRH